MPDHSDYELPGHPPPPGRVPPWPLTPAEEGAVIDAMTSTPRPAPGPLAVRCRACLAPRGENCVGTTSDLPREHPHKLRPLAAFPRLVHCPDCEGSGWRETGRRMLAPQVTCPVCGAGPTAQCTEGGAERRDLHVVRRRAARAGLEPCPSCDAVGWVPEPAAPSPGDTWTVAVQVPITLPREARDSLFAAVADAAHDWEPDERDGWDVTVTTHPTAQQPAAPRPEGQFWKDLRENLKDPEFRETYIAFSQEIATQQPTAPRPDVPDEWVTLAQDTDAAYASTRRPDGGGWTRATDEQVRRFIAAVVPVVERQVRERVAAEILSGFGELDPADDYDQGVMDAAKKARSES